MSIYNTTFIHQRKQIIIVKFQFTIENNHYYSLLHYQLFIIRLAIIEL